jgi:hypothetical protein
MYGRVIHQDGSAASRSTVQIYQLTNEDKARIGVAMFSLGFFCLVPGFCPRSATAKVGPQGGYAFPADSVKAAPHVSLTARHSPAPGQESGAQVVVEFELPSASPARLPDVRYWEPTVAVHAKGSDAEVSWPAPSASPHGGQTHYALWTVSGDGGPQPTGVETDGRTATLDLRPYEDQPAALVVIATTTVTIDGREYTFAYHAGSVPLPSAGAPPSRRRPCAVGDPGKALIPAATPCAATDGVLDVNAAVSDGSPAPSPTRHRICVDLGEPRRLSLVVFRTPFLTTGTVVEVSPDGNAFTTAGRPPTDRAGGSRSIYPVRLDSQPRVRFACVRDDRFGFAGAVLNELSAW